MDTEPKSLNVGWHGKCGRGWSLRFLVTVLVPELCYLASDHLCHMRMNKHVWDQAVHDEPLWCRHRSVQINNELCHGYITAKEGITSAWIIQRKRKRNSKFTFLRSLPGDEQPLDCINHFFCAMHDRKVPAWQVTLMSVFWQLARNTMKTFAPR